MPTAYRIENSPNNRAVCQNTECKKNTVKITKGEIRFGTWVEIQEHGGWKWRHWGCTTPQVIANLLESSGGDTDLVDGYDDVSADMQEKVKRALKQGHVDDEDWKGDVEVNRPGMKGFRLPTPKKKAKKDSDDEEANGAGSNGSPIKPAAKKATGKRGRPAKVKNEDGEANVEPPAKKRRGRPAKSIIKVKVDDDEDGSEDVPAKKQRSKKKVKQEDEDITEDVPSKKQRSKKKNVKQESEDEAEADAIETKPKRGRKKTAAKDSDTTENPPTKGIPNRKKAAK